MPKLLLKGLTRFRKSLLFYFSIKKKTKEDSSRRVLLVSFHVSTHDETFYGSNNSNITSSRQAFSVDVIPCQQSENLFFLVCQKLFKYFFLSLLRKDNKL